MRITHWIDGKPYTDEADRWGDVFDPATGEIRDRVDFASTEVVDGAVASASRAFAGWRDMSLAKRSQVLFSLREILSRRVDDLAAIITAEHGKTFDDAQGEVRRGLEVVELACGLGHLLKGQASENVSTGIDASSARQPLGVVVGITPFNFPVMVPLWMCPIAVACGNAFILKPSEKDPSASLLLAELWSEAGLPEGIFNVVQGDRVAVDALLTHPDVAAVSFVGSTPIARHVYETGTAHGKRVQALGGAKNHMVVLPDADVDVAADAATSAGFGAAGERCMAVSVVVAVDPVGDRLVEAIADRARSVRVGPGADPDSQMGPLITREHRDRVAGYLDEGVAEGAALVVDGRDLATSGEPGGFWLGPSVFDQVGAEMSVYTDEIFGPVLSVVRAPSYEEALELVNANPYGNGAAIFTADGGAARRFAHEVKAGMVGINVPIPVPPATFPFGGWKSSLFGDTHVYGTEGVHFYTRNKVTLTRWPEPSDERALQLGFPRNS